MISSKLIKDIKYEIATPLSMLINNYIESGIVPDNLKIAKIVPIFKAKETHLVEKLPPNLITPCYIKNTRKGCSSKLVFFPKYK